MKLYHGILKSNLKEMLTDGVSANAYWGETEEACKYSDCDKAIEIDSDDVAEILPNETLINYHQRDDSEEYSMWLASEQKWEDALRIFGSVIIPQVISFNKSQIIKL